METFSIATVNFCFHHLRKGGGSTLLQEAKRDLLLDGVAFSRLE